jgi:phosphoglycolate phosphatase-like HAD superfamily hydrolase
LPQDSSVNEWASRLASEYTRQCESAIASSAEIPGASQLFNELTNQGYPLFINSATPEKPLWQILQLRHWDHFFEDIYGAEASKADNLKFISAKTGATRGEIVHIGDQFDDLQATEQFGCHFVAMAAANSGPVGKVSPLVVTDLWSLPAIIAKLNLEES